MRLLITVLLVLTSSLSFCQKNNLNKNIDATFAIGDQQGSLSVLFLTKHSIGSAKKFHLGLGIRYTGYLGLNRYFITAPAILTSGSTSPLILFQDNISKNIDSLIVKSSFSHSINAAINFDYQISKTFQVGFNIDLIGFSFGNTSAANYINGFQGKNTTASPTQFNILLISDNDRGSLNSEFYGKYSINDKWGIKLAAQFLFIEYTTATKVQTVPQENDRFRYKSLLPSIGVTYKF